MTLKDIADKAGVSMMTVSNVINGKHSRVSAKTIEKVNAIIKECGYIPNLSARNLTSRTSSIVGIVIPLDENTLDDNYMENPYVSTMIGTIEKELRRNGYYTMVRSVSKAQDITSLFKNWNVDGIIFLYPDDTGYIKQFIESVQQPDIEVHCPVAVFDSQLSVPGLINICSDDEKGLYLSTKYMINRGHSQIAFVADYKENYLLTQRFHGYCRALEESGIPFREEFVFTNSPSYEGGIAAGKAIASCKLKPTGVVTTADICAIGIMEGARLGGLRVPVDLSVTGYDNLNLCQYTSPKLTSISQNIPQKALLATQLLLKKIKGEESNSPECVTMDVEIVERQSVISMF